jgi:aspartate/methionine/tyrosine aminotransferase
MIGANTLMQACIPKLLNDTPRTLSRSLSLSLSQSIVDIANRFVCWCVRVCSEEFYDNTMKILETNATTLFDALQNIAGITPIAPQGAMYISHRFTCYVFFIIVVVTRAFYYTQ